ncbi:MAG TPA: hypothetical protein EYQ39_03430 [Gemmatimonadetes bacterium]|jgi:hypothetical protein|nr:hypothetical protein [Gemmatimonadota bacterium]HIL89991.1 hypothetical protein [Gemmatimonadota bacterium]
MDRTGQEAKGQERADAIDLVTIPGIHRRFLDTFFSPAKMNVYLAAEPRWVMALVLSAALMSLQVALIPSEVWESLMREQSLAQGGTPFPMPDWVADWMGILTAVGAALSTSIAIPIGAGVLTGIFAFILGDAGGYRQYLAVTAHSFFIPALVGLFIMPLKIATQDPQLTLNLGSFFFFLPSGYWLGVLTAMDLTQIWSSLVIAQGAHCIDRRRSFTSAAVILLSLMLAMALIIGRFMPN